MWFLRCWCFHGIHGATAQRLGVSSGALQHVPQDLEVAPVSPKPSLCLLIHKARTANVVTAADATAALAAGWDETAPCHTIAITALSMPIKRAEQGLGIDLDPAYVKPAAERLADHGCLALPTMLSGLTQIPSIGN